MKYLYKHIELIIISSFLLLYTLAASSISLNRFWQYNAFWYDFGIFDETAWKVSRFQLPLITQLNPPLGRNVWGDHFNPSVISLIPLYRITYKPEIILVAQVAFVVLSAWVFYLISRKFINSSLMRIALIFSYLLYIGLQNALFTDVHNIVFALLPLSLTFWALFNQKWKLYWLFLLLTLGWQENLSTVGIGIGMYLIVISNPFRKLGEKSSLRKIFHESNFRSGILTILLSLLWAILTTRLIMPAISGSPYSYQPTIPVNITGWITGLIFPVDMKLKTILVSILTFGGFAIITPSVWPLLILHFLERFVLNQAGTRWDLGMHYNAPLSPILIVAAIEAIIILQKNPRIKSLLPFWAIGIILINIFFHWFYLHGPLLMATRPEFYQATTDTRFLNDFTAHIPRNGLLMTQNNLATHFTHNQVMLLNHNVLNTKPDYVAIDLRPGQNANDFFPLSEDDTKRLTASLSANPAYTLQQIARDQFLFIKQ